MSERATRLDFLPVLMLAYCAASLMHFVHNGVFIEDYPNLPATLSPALVYATWLGITSIGIAGYLLLRRGFHLLGLMVVGVYAALGFDGLAHYTLAPLSDHTLAMNLSIWLEVLTAAALLIVVARRLAHRMRSAQRF